MLFRYRYDTETGLYYLQSRYYNPEWGRFINADTIAGNIGELLGHNIFAYCKNNPVNSFDPSGFRTLKNDFSDPDDEINSYFVEYNTGNYKTYTADNDWRTATATVGPLGAEGSVEMHTPYWGLDTKYLSLQGQVYSGGSAQLAATTLSSDEDWDYWGAGANIAAKVGVRVKGRVWIFNVEAQGGGAVGLGGGGSTGVSHRNHKYGLSLEGALEDALGAEANLKIWVDLSSLYK